MPRQCRVGGAAQDVRQRRGSTWAVAAIGWTGGDVGGYRRRRLAAQGVGADAEIGQDLGGGGNVGQGMQEMIEPHVCRAVEMRDIVGAVAARQHQLVGAIGLGSGAAPRPPSVCEI